MRQNILTLLWFAVFGLLCASSNAFAQKPLLAAVNNYIGKQEISLEAAEYPKARKIIRADLDGDGDKDAAVQYTLEGFAGGNNWSQMLAVFRNDKGVYKFAAEDTVGGKFSDRMFILKKVVGRKIYAATQSCPEIPQGICRNPKKGQAIFAFRKGKLQEL